MKTDIRLNVQLEVPAQQILSNLRFYNEDVERQVEEGVKLAIEELANEENLSRLVADEVKKKLKQNIVEYVLSYQVKAAISKSIEDAVLGKIQTYADEVATKVSEQLNFKELKETLENTLINNLESHYYKDMNGDLCSGIDFDSIQTCADYISKEIVELMVEFAKSIDHLGYPDDHLITFANDFLTQRFKDKA